MRTKGGRVPKGSESIKNEILIDSDPFSYAFGSEELLETFFQRATDIFSGFSAGGTFSA